MSRPAVPVILLHPDDNIVVCCRSVTAGERFHLNTQEQIEAIQAVELGHKLARRALSVGDKVIKYGAPIGSMTVAAQAGEWIHLHNMKSDYIGVHTRATSTSGS